MKNNKILLIAVITAAILMIPLIAMQFTHEVNWTLFDFIVAGSLIFGTGLLLEYTLRKVTNRKQRIVFVVIIMLIFLLVWAELAVGVFGSPFAGS